ncbi:MAG: hypothetical protein PVJ27_00270 [Candidatus Brocadiaceae bacterium]|jgi:hypothetical protein
MLEEHDERTRRCPRLGHQVRFHYCRTQEGSSLCLRILDCWWEAFDVQSFLREHYPAEELKRIRRHEPRDKVTNILDIIQQARRRAQEGDREDEGAP